MLRGWDCFINAGEAVEETEQRIGSLYGLFCLNGTEPPDVEERRRIIYIQE